MEMVCWPKWSMWHRPLADRCDRSTNPLRFRLTSSQRWPSRAKV